MMKRFRHIRPKRVRLASGKVCTYRYHRKTNRRIYGEPGTPEFMKSYCEAANFKPEKANGTLQWLIEEYKSAQEFARLAPRTQRDYDKQLVALVEKWGSMPLKVLDDRRIRKDIKNHHDALACKSKRHADYFLAVLSVVCSYGVDIGVLSSNRIKGIRKCYASDRSDKIWTSQHIEAFLSVASEPMRLALLLALHTGQRQGDLLALPWSAYDGNVIKLKQSKTQQPVAIPCTTALKAALEAAPRSNAANILTNSRGQPWTSDGFRASWHKASRKAGLIDLTFHDLRGTAVTMLAEAGCTIPEIAACTGHSLRNVNSILERYLSPTEALAQSAISKFERFETDSRLE